MSNLAVANTTFADNGVASIPVTIGGVTLPPGNTAAQRLEAHAKAGTVSQYLTDSTAMRFAQADGQIGGKEAPPDPKALEASRRAELDQITADVANRHGKPTGTPSGTPGEFDQEGFDALTAHYKLLARGTTNPEAAARFRAAYENDVRKLHEGKKLTAEQVAKLKGSAGNVETFMPKEKAPPVSPHSPQVWAEAHVSVADSKGFVPLNRINKDGLSGYTLPKLIDGQTYHVGVFQELANARAAGVTQKQVDAFIRAGMVRDGWLKA